MTAIRGLIDRIEVRAGAKRRETEVSLVGTLAGILDLGTNKNAALRAAVRSCWLRE